MNAPAAIRSRGKRVEARAFAAVCAALLFDEQCDIRFGCDLFRFDAFFDRIDYQIADACGFFRTRDFVGVFYHAEFCDIVVHAVFAAVDVAAFERVDVF